MHSFYSVDQLCNLEIHYNASESHPRCFLKRQIFKFFKILFSGKKHEWQWTDEDFRQKIDQSV
jgi:hypothetical protein